MQQQISPAQKPALRDSQRRVGQTRKLRENALRVLAIGEQNLDPAELPIRRDGFQFPVSGKAPESAARISSAGVELCPCSIMALS